MSNDVSRKNGRGSVVKIAAWTAALDVLFPIAVLSMPKVFSEMLPQYQRFEVPLEIASAYQWLCIVLMGIMLAALFAVSQNPSSWAPVALVVGGAVSAICMFFDPHGELSIGLSPVRLLMVSYILSAAIWFWRKRTVS